MALRDPKEPQTIFKRNVHRGGTTLQKFAEKLGVSKSYIYKVSSGDVLPSERLKRKIEHELDLPPWEVWDLPIR